MTRFFCYRNPAEPLGNPFATVIRLINEKLSSILRLKSPSITVKFPASASSYFSAFAIFLYLLYQQTPAKGPSLCSCQTHTATSSFGSLMPAMRYSADICTDIYRRRIASIESDLLLSLSLCLSGEALECLNRSKNLFSNEH